MKQVKLIDVANKAGVSKSTASQFLNGRFEYMSAATKLRLEAAVNELGFIPNQLARSLKTKKTNTIGVMVNSINGPTTSDVIRGIDDYLKSKGYNVLIYNTDYKKATELASIANLQAQSADGLIITSSGEINDLLNDEGQLGMPVVHIHRTFDDLKVNTVLSDFRSGAYMGTDYLIQQGHKRIGVMTRPYANIPSRQERLEGYYDALEAHGLARDEALVDVVDDQETIGGLLSDLLALADPPTALFVMYSRLTKDLLLYCNTHDIKIPEDFSLIAFDDLPMAPLFKTPLTVIDQSSYELGIEAAKLLLTKISQPEDCHEDVVLPCHLVVRGSCQGPKG